MKLLGIVLLKGLLVLTISLDSGKESYLNLLNIRSSVTTDFSYDIPKFPAGPDSNFDHEEFQKIARSGIPSVFIGAASNWAELRGISCEDYSRRWPNASMRAEYTGLSEAETFLKLGESDWVNSTRSPRGMSVPSEDCDDEHAQESRPVVAPFVWHVKDRVARSIKQEIGSMFKGLPWLNRGSLTDEHSRDTMEFWFQQVGAGTFAHNDGYCHSVFSMQLRGEKRWRFMLTPPAEKLERDVFDEFDSGIYQSVHRWEPDFEVVLKAGDGVLFPPGYMHETRTVAGPSESDTCATSVTFNIPVPMPSRFIREFLPRFSVSREIHQCMRRWESYVTARVVPVVWEKPTNMSKQSEILTQEIFAQVDLNRDGLIDMSEVTAHIQDPRNRFGEQRGIRFADVSLSFDPRRRLSPSQIEEALSIRARDTLDMWDLNDDGFASFEEVRDLIDYFQYYSWRHELVQTAVTAESPEGEFINIPIGSELFKKRLSIVDTIMERLREDLPQLDLSKYPLMNVSTTDNSRSEL
jgi:hypothetical protein